MKIIEMIVENKTILLLLSQRQFIFPCNYTEKLNLMFKFGYVPKK